MKHEKSLSGDTNFLKGVSTLDVMKKALKTFLLLLTITTFDSSVFGGHSILDRVDPNFNVQIETDSFSIKSVEAMVAQPDDKMLVSGIFNTFNRQPVTGLIRLTADGLLDPTFNNNLLALGGRPNRIYLQPDGKIIIGGLDLKLNGSNAPLPAIVRLNADGTVDSSFNFPNSGGTSTMRSAAIGADGKILVAGIFPITENGTTIFKPLLRLNSDGTIDNSFSFNSSHTVTDIALQNDKPIAANYDSQMSQYVVSRLTANGSVDPTFTRIPSNNVAIRAVRVTPDNKILVQNEQNLRRFNEDGSSDATFQTVLIDGGGRGDNLHIGSDGRITFAQAINGNSSTRIRRILSNGAPDPTFTNYSQVNFGQFAVQSDNEIFVGDQTFFSNGIFNEYVHLFAGGAVDTAFNPGGIGFQTINPGIIGAIGVQSDQKIIIGGMFDFVNNVGRKNIARLNADNTVDNSFQINMTAAGNYFSQIQEVYTVRIQPNGKIIVTGAFKYVLNGAVKFNMVRLNTDGSIDPTFNLGAYISDLYAPNGAGKNKTATQSDGKLVIATSRSGPDDMMTIPSRFNPDGSKDSTFNPILYNSPSGIFTYDAAIQPDQKILISGLEASSIGGFIARLNADGSTDNSFQRNEEAGKIFGEFNLLANGKILIVKANAPYYTSSQSVILRLNANGSPDATFTVGSGANGTINAMLLMPSGQTLLGGKFTTYNGQARQNLALINADGTLAATAFSVNQEVMSLAIDGEGRVLVGGSFTLINIDGGQNFVRSYVARLTGTNRTRFDFDGDGKSDLGVFTAASGNWSILNSRTNQSSNVRFGQSGDRLTPADYDGDGKADVAVFRPSNGTWYLSQSTAGFAGYQWGAATDKPVAGDFNGDGKADIAVWRPSNGVWYILRGNGQYDAYRFGTAGDIPAAEDYDGDGKTDIAVFKPSNGTFYWLASATGNELKGMRFGASGDVPVVADYNGDGRADLVLFRPSQGTWHQCLTAASGGYTFATRQFGQNGDEPVAADYDGDGKSDLAIRRQGVWHLLKSNQGFSAAAFGDASAQAVVAPPNQ